ncbi:MAG: peptidoglycan bridge formation glycyltransferase FemA/FemB family protein [Candidatus Sericytochromatia bacterium]|nr:peptidoglycan bridge formation glycyltransferase FemA/FemB family protein [Candidatus Sericytochromatia bacterium]
MSLTARLLPMLAAGDPLADAWENLVQACPQSGFMQSLGWAAVKRGQGLSVVHVGVFDGDTLVGGALCFGQDQPNGASLMIAPEGPVLPWDRPAVATACLQVMMTCLETLAKTMGAIALRVEPRLGAPKPPALRTFGRAPIDLVPQQTLYRDIAADDAGLLAAMQPKGRYNIRLADRKGVTVTVSQSPADAHRFYGILRETAERDDFFIEPASYFALITDVLMPLGMARLLFAKHEGETLGTLLLITYGERATYFYGGITNDKRPMMAGYALQWAAMRQARDLGCRVYDFFGFEPFGDPTHLYAGFSRFKKQFGGEAVRFIGAQDHMFNESLADAVIRAFQEIDRGPVAMAP